MENIYMTNFKLVTAANPEKKIAAEYTISEAHLCYVNLNEARKKYQSEDKEWSVTFVVDEDTSDELTEMFPKMSCKSIKTGDFEAKYKFAAPFPDQKKQFIHKLSVAELTDEYVKNAQNKWEKTGNRIVTPYHMAKRPKAYELEDGKIVDITTTKLVGNGSKGVVKIASSANSFGTFPYLRAVLIQELVEYEKKESGGVYNPFADFGTLDTSSLPTFEDKPAETKQAEPTPVTNFEPEDDFDSNDIPF